MPNKLRELFMQPLQSLPQVKPITIEDDREGLAEQLELAEQELLSVRQALAVEEKANEALVKQLRETENALVYLVKHRPCTLHIDKPPMEDTLAEILLRINTRPNRPVFVK